MFHNTLKIVPYISLAVATAACSLPPPPTPGSVENTDTDDTAGDDAQPAPDLPGPDPVQLECTQFRAQTETVLRDKCGNCHDNGQAQGGLGDISILDGLIPEYVTPGSRDDSLLWDKVESGAMPLVGDPLTASELQSLAGWIDCAEAEEESRDPSLTDPPGCPTNKPVSFDEVLRTILADVVTLDPDRAKTTRYVTFTHLIGTGFCEAQLEGYRHAFVKLLNHLSLDPQIRQPVTVDPSRTIYRIDLNDYKWTAETWATITDADPYAIDLQSEDAQLIQTLTQIDKFSIKGDWFMDAGSQPPLYHEILGIPATLAELEEDLGFNFDEVVAAEDEFDGDDVIFAGFQRSGVAEFNRVIARVQLGGADYRVYWISFDFLNAEGKRNIFNNPTDFEEDGGEIIFTLPNGLLGFMVVNAAGDRVDRVPVTIAHDRETPEEPEVINGLSCLSCHRDGMRLATDEIRDFVAAAPTNFPDLIKEQVANRYAPREVFDAKQKFDNTTFADSLARTGASSRVGDYEPVMASHLAFIEPLDLPRAAAEFGISETELLKNVGKLKELNTIDLTKVDRKAFQNAFAINACLLNLGVTAACPDGIVPQ